MGIHMFTPHIGLGKITTVTIYAELGDGSLLKSDVDFNTAHDATDADTADDIADEYFIGTSVAIIGGQWSIERIVIPFDTSAIPPGAVIIEAILSLYYFAASYVTLDPPDIVVVDGNDCAATLEVADYGILLPKIAKGGSISVPDITTSAYNAIILNGIGRGFIKKGAMTKLAFRSSFDIDNYEEWGNASAYSANKGTGFKPKLVVTYRI